jgi:3alpha(or 20beta)-hydroxysteroid dehydrogenase
MTGTLRHGRVQGKVAIVSGAGGGLGAAFVQALAAEGALVIAADVDLAAAAATAEKVGSGCEALQVDVREELSWSILVAEVRRRHGRLDGLVNNAGIVIRGGITDMPLADFEAVLGVNLTGTFLGMQHCAPLMRESGGGSIVNIASTAGLTGVPAISGYTASKWGVRGLTRSAAVELAPWGIRVNSLAPGVVSTPMAARSASAVSNLLGRPGSVDEIAPLVVHLISGESTYSTGADFVVDGGETATSRLSDTMRS